MRMRSFLPLLLAPLALPGAAVAETGICADASDRIGCLMASVDAAFNRHVGPAQTQNSISRAMARQARDLAISTSYCSAETATASTPVCDIQRADSYAVHQQHIAQETVARAENIRALEASRTAEQIAIIAASAIDYQPQQDAAHRVWIKDALVAAAKERVRRFAMQQNELTQISMARINAELDRQRDVRMSPCNVGTDTRARCTEQYQPDRMEQQPVAIDVVVSASLSPCNVVKDARPRCVAQYASDMTATRNIAAKLSTGSLGKVRPAKAYRDVTAVLEQCRSAGYSSSGCTLDGASLAQHSTRAQAVAMIVDTCRSAGYSASGCRFDAANQNFVVAGVREADRVKLAYGSRAALSIIASFEPCRSVGYSQDGCRVDHRGHQLVAGNSIDEPTDNSTMTAREIARGAYKVPGLRAPPLETGAITVPQLQTPPAFIEPNNGLREISDDGCDLTGKPFGPLHFIKGVVVDHRMNAELDRLAVLAKSCPGMRIEIQGFSDRTGSEATVRALAHARAKAVSDYLITKGIAPNRLSAVSRSNVSAKPPYGQSIRFADNRRVEFVIRDPSMDEVARRVMWELADLLDPTYIPPVAGLSP